MASLILRETITAWLICPPTSTTTASAGTNKGVHEGSVNGAIKISPVPRDPGSEGSVTTLAIPSTTPGHPPKPSRDSPTFKGLKSSGPISSRSCHKDGSGKSPSKIKGGTLLESSLRICFRSVICLSKAEGFLINSSNSVSRTNHKSMSSLLSRC